MVKNINTYISEKLQISSKGNSNDPTEILNKNINSLESLKDILFEYFTKLQYDFKVTDISNLSTRWKFQDSKNGIIVDDHFTLKFYKNSKCLTKLQLSIFHNNILMQIKKLDYKGVWENYKIHGMSRVNTFKIGDNLYDFLYQIKKHTDEYDIFDRDEHIVDLFKLN